MQQLERVLILRIGTADIEKLDALKRNLGVSRGALVRELLRKAMSGQQALVEVGGRRT